MSNENGLVSMAQQFSGLPIKSLIGAPLMAAAEANSQMALTQTHFLLNTCFNQATEKDKDGNETSKGYQPIMIDMTLTRPVINADGTPGTPAKTIFSLPLLTILPLNSLAVDDIKIHFEMEVKSSFSNDKETSQTKSLDASADFTAKYGVSGFSVEVHGSVSASQKDSNSEKSHYEKSNSAKYEIDVHAGQLPLPQGVTTIIQAFTASISPIQLKAA